jgi:hypothetical protein
MGAGHLSTMCLDHKITFTNEISQERSVPFAVRTNGTEGGEIDQASFQVSWKMANSSGEGTIQWNFLS